jgi:hypothetical protein
VVLPGSARSKILPTHWASVDITPSGPRGFDRRTPLDGKLSGTELSHRDMVLLSELADESAWDPVPADRDRHRNAHALSNAISPPAGAFRSPTGEKILMFAAQGVWASGHL